MTRRKLISWLPAVLAAIGLPVAAKAKADQMVTITSRLPNGWQRTTTMPGWLENADIDETIAVMWKPNQEYTVITRVHR